MRKALLSIKFWGERNGQCVEVLFRKKLRN